MKNYPHILSKVYGEPWLITPEKHSAIRSVLNSRMTEALSFSNDDDSEEDDDATEPKTFGSSTMIIPVCGVIGNRLSAMEIECGGCDLSTLKRNLQVAQADDNIERIILDFDSPGGTINGVPEVGELISIISEEKEVFAFTETLMCSGAYWLASQASQIFCTGSARVGSIGVYSIFEDWSKALEEDGVKVNAISAGEMKLAGAYFKPMTESEREMFQSRTDKIYDQFKSTILSKRKVSDEYMQGQVFDGEDSALYGLVDATVDSIEDLIR